MAAPETSAAIALTSQERYWRKLREFGPLLLLVLLMWGGSQVAQHWQTRGQAEKLRSTVRPGDIVMLSSSNCVFCLRARTWLDAEKIAYSECFIETDADCAALYRAQMAPGTPTFLVKGQRVVGFDKQRLIDILTAGGS
ncbi:glutaredoxin family protein [Roseateles oligotrophus]|uniref:Glutaredoxin family protein n=1 Tax=Roseateles oligotrophus TaxID=1769250 RepID=A0ABT2YC55_9BURK|nr:glutaredoxin family protein [Roseateles oligotrophus]MCV2367626.1 glutaredoxin family protein [Roseateles oligotrophus]